MWINPQESANFVKFTEEILNKKISFFAQCKILMPWEAKKAYVWTKYERTGKRIYEPN